MADKAISELIAASEITGSDLFVLEQSGTAKKLSGQTLTTFLLQLVGAHGGISSIEKTSTSGLVDAYTITMADQSTTVFTVTNGAKGDKGDNSYVWVKYSSSLPTKDSDIYDTPDNYMGIYSGTANTAPTTYTSYNWFQIKGAKGDTGSPATLTSQSVQYQASTSGTVIPSGTWLDAVPTVAQGQYLWTRSTLKFNTGDTQYSYSVSRFGIDGTGTVITVNNKSPDMDGNVNLTPEDVGIYPVGAIYISAVSTSPASLFGGTWEQIKDVFLLAAGATYAAGDTGGEATHTITTQEMPAHTHSYKAASKMPGNNLDGGFMISSENLYGYDLSDALNIAGHGQPMNIMPPYLTVYVWKRVA